MGVVSKMSVEDSVVSGLCGRIATDLILLLLSP